MPGSLRFGFFGFFPPSPGSFRFNATTIALGDPDAATVTVDTLATTMLGPITANGGTLVKTGAGDLILNPLATGLTGATLQVDAGRLVADGVIGLRDSGEWACKGRTAFWGYVKYPWVRLDWPSPQWIEKVVLYDRPALDEHLAGGKLEFSDGSEITVTTIPNDGTAKVITFAAREVTCECYLNHSTARTVPRPPVRRSSPCRR